MNPRRNIRIFLGNPEVRDFGTQSDEFRKLHNLFVAQRRKGFLIPFNKRLKVLLRGVDCEMVDFAGRHGYGNLRAKAGDF